MVQVTQQVCACEPCVCVIDIDDAVTRGGKNYCSDACADGHPNGPGCCGNSSCGC
ncbi:MAG: metallothionein [Pseudomonadota bacterium]